MTETKQAKTGHSALHLPTILLGVIVAAVFLIAIFSYQVAATERALVITMGKNPVEFGPGLHFRWPLPFQEVIRYDVRLRTFDGNIGKLEELNTKDGRNVIVGIYVIYKLENLQKFKTAAKNLAQATNYLSDRMRAVKGGVIGKFNFDEMINTDPSKMKLDEIKQMMLSELQPDLLSSFGIKVVSVGIRSIGVPQNSAAKIAERMKEERVTAAAIYRDKGRQVAQTIRTDADKFKREELTKAEATAKELMAKGDAEAAQYYAVFNEDPVLAAFLRKLDAMKKIVSTKTTLVLDTDSTPFDIFQMKVDFGGDKKVQPK